MARPWTEDETSIVIKLINEGYAYTDIAKELEAQGYLRTHVAIRNHFSRHYVRTKCTSPEFSPPEVNELSSLGDIDDDTTYPKKRVRQGKTVGEYKEALRKMKEKRDQSFRVTTERFIKVGNPVDPCKKILTLSDFHVPFYNELVIRHALDNHGDADILVINGDLFDAYAVSKWDRDKEIVLEDEYKMALHWVREFSKIFPKVVLVSGNHENRTKRHFSTRINPEASFMVDSDLMSHIARGEDVNEHGKLAPKYDFPNVYYERSLSWYKIIGKAVFVHPTKGFSTVPGATVRKFAEGLRAKEDFQCMIMSHTHQQISYPWDHMLLMDQGCCCVPLAYEEEGNAAYKGQTMGYAVIYMDAQGNVDFDKSRPIFVCTGSAVKEGDPLELLK